MLRSLTCFSSVAFETVPKLVGLTMAFSRPSNGIVERFVLASTVSSFSTLLIFRDARHLCWPLCLLVFLLGSFPLFQQVLDRAPTGVFGGGGDRKVDVGYCTARHSFTCDNNNKIIIIMWSIGLIIIINYNNGHL